MGASAASADAQVSVRTAVEENVRREPQGQILGRLAVGTPLLRVGIEGSWSEITMEGWVWTASLQATDREGFDLVVSASGGENLRSEPSGAILGRLEVGTLLEELERRPGWARVRRTGWIWSASLSAPASTSSGASPAPGRAGAAPSSSQATSFLRVPEGAALLSVPDGDTLATASGGGDFEVLARQGNWVRVRMEGWVWRPPTADAAADEGPTQADVTPETLAGPEGASLVGARVVWRIQFISLERAEAVRTDFYEGEPFILGRVGGGDGPFVYVAVPPERLQAVQGLAPLEMVTITGRVRRASSTLTRTPILDLLAVQRGAGW
jgi:hypothetical protein